MNPKPDHHAYIDREAHEHDFPRHEELDLAVVVHAVRQVPTRAVGPVVHAETKEPGYGLKNEVQAELHGETLESRYFGSPRGEVLEGTDGPPHRDDHPVGDPVVDSVGRNVSIPGDFTEHLVVPGTPLDRDEVPDDSDELVEKSCH